MNYAAMPGQRVTQPPNPASGASQSDAINFMPTQRGVGSNQYQNLPPWMAIGGSMNWSPGGGSGSLPMSGLAGGTGGVFSSPTAYGSNYGLGVPQQGQSYGAPASSWSGAGGGPIIGGGLFSVEQPVNPALQGSLGGYLTSQVGQGVTPFNLPTALPFGGTTAPGQLNAMANPLLQQLMQGYQSGNFGNVPGMGTLSTIANQGISALPEWQSMVNAMGQNTAQNQAQLAEQFGSMGGLGGTSFGNAMSNYMQGVNAQQNALLGQLQQTNILQGQIPAAEQMMQGATGMGQYAQGLNQQAIQNMYNEMIRTSPQYNPTMGYQYGMATTYDPVLNRAGMTSGGILGGLAGAAPGILGAIAGLIP